MTDAENLVLSHLRALRTALTDVSRDQRETRARVNILEQQGAVVLREIANLYEQGAANAVRLDRISSAVQEIATRLDLVE